jgi:hypothetical protein
MAVIFKNVAAQFIFGCHSGRTGDGNCFKMKQSKKHLRHSFPAEFGRARFQPLPQNHRPVCRHFSDLFFMRHLRFIQVFGSHFRGTTGSALANFAKSNVTTDSIFSNCRSSVVRFPNKVKKLF